MARALVISAWGEPPELREVEGPPPGPGTARLRAAALNPVDLAIGGGRFYLPLPEPPFVAGVEAVAELDDGSRVWCLDPSGGRWAEGFACPPMTVPVPEGLSDTLAAALGVAGLAGWMPVRERGELAPGERVLVLGASGVVGQVAIQAAREGGAGRVVGAARSASGRERALELGADAVLDTEGLDADALRTALGGPADLVVDALWGPPFVAALGAMARGGRIVQVGGAAAQTAEVAAGPFRGGRLDLRGFSVFTEALEDVARAYADLAAAAARGAVRLEVEEVPFERAAEAWADQASGAGGRKLVLVPSH